MSRAWLVEQLASLTPSDSASAQATRDRVNDILRPSGALARLDEIAIWISSWQRSAQPAVSRPVGLIFAANHGVAAAGVSNYPVDVTAAMVAAFEAHSSTVTAFADIAGATVSVVDVGVNEPSNDFRTMRAVDAERVDHVIDVARRTVDALDTDLLVLGEMGIGNTTAAAAVAHALYGGQVHEWVGRGTGVDDAGLARKQQAVARGVARMERDDPDASGIDVVAEVGGLELVAMAAAIVAARQRSLPVLLDGYVVSAAAAALLDHHRDALAHCRAGHRSAEPGHRRLLALMGLDPLLDLDMRLGEASGAMAAVPLVRMACAAVTRVPTFTEWFSR